MHSFAPLSVGGWRHAGPDRLAGCRAARQAGAAPIGRPPRRETRRLTARAPAAQTSTMTAPFDNPDLYVNVALGKPATQSSRPAWCPLGPDGLVNGDFSQEYNAHTDVDQPAWWQVDLGQRLPLSAIVVHNRREMAREAARSLRVEVSDDGAAWTLIHAGLTHFRARGQAIPLQLPLAGLVWARFVKLSLDEPQPLVLTQVEVFVERPALELIRLREEHDLDIPLLAETPGAVEQMSYALVGAPGTRDRPLIGVSLVLNAALGNGLMQHTMAIAVARRLGLRYFKLATRESSGVIARTEPWISAVSPSCRAPSPARGRLVPGGLFLGAGAPRALRPGPADAARQARDGPYHHPPALQSAAAGVRAEAGRRADHPYPLGRRVQHLGQRRLHPAAAGLLHPGDRPLPAGGPDHARQARLREPPQPGDRRA